MKENKYSEEQYQSVRKIFEQLKDLYGDAPWEEDEEGNVIRLIKSLENEEDKMKLFDEYGQTLSCRYDSLKIANACINDKEIKYKVYNWLVEANADVLVEFGDENILDYDAGFLFLDEDLNFVSKLLKEYDDSDYLASKIVALPKSKSILRGRDMEERVELFQNYIDRYLERHKDDWKRRCVI